MNKLNIKNLRRFLVVFFLAVTQFSFLFTNYSYAQVVSPTPVASNSQTEQLPVELSAPDSTSSSVVAPVFANDLSQNVTLRPRRHSYVLSLAKKSYQAKEDVQVVVKNSDGSNLNAVLEGPDVTPIVDKEVSNGDTIFTISPNSNLQPGRYKIKVLDTNSSQLVYQQDFSWGVLAINTNKSIYFPGETAQISIAVLDPNGNMECHALVSLDITDPFGQVTHLSMQEGTITKNPECYLHQYTQKPDYESSYQVDQLGRYTMTLTADTPSNGSYSTTDRFEVRSSVPFDVERLSATRIYPPSLYPVHLKIKANESFTGKIVEAVPESFQISPLSESGVYDYTQINSTSQTSKESYGIPKLHLPFNGTYPVTEGFGQQLYDKQEISVYKKSGLDGHDGVDFGLPDGTAVLSVDDGKVILAQPGWIYGTSVVIQHKWGRSYYGHLSKLEVKEGDIVSSAQEIGLSGHTGLATGPHLHFGIKPKNSDIYNLYYGKIDPAPFLGISSEDPVLSVSSYPNATKAVVWNVDVQKGAEFTIGYQFRTPPKSPDFYITGPLQFISSKIDSQPQAKFDVKVNPFVLGEATSSGVLINASASDSAALNSQDQASPSPVDHVVFQEIREWQLAIDAAKVTILTSGSSFTIPRDWNNSNYSIEAVGAGGNGTAAVAAGRGGGGGGGGGYSKTTTGFTFTAGNSVGYQIGTAGGGVGTGDSYFCNTAAGGNCTDTAGTFGSAVAVGAHGGGNATNNSGGAGGSTTGAVGDTGAKFAGGGGGSADSGTQMAGAGGGGAGGPNGAGGTAANPAAVSGDGGSGGGGNGGGSGSTAPNSTSGTAGGNNSASAGGGSAGAGGSNTCTDGNASTASSAGGGGGGGGGTTGNAAACNGGDGSVGSTEWAFGWGTGGGGGGGGSSSRTASSGNAGGNAGNALANSGAGGGGGGAGKLSGGNLGNGGGGFIIVTFTPATATLNLLMRHGEYFSGGVREGFSF